MVQRSERIDEKDAARIYVGGTVGGDFNHRAVGCDPPSEFVFSGDCTNRMFFAPPFGSNTVLNINDADMDDATQLGLDWDQLIHDKSKNNVLFADGHVAPFGKFMPAEMTHDYKERGVDWGEIDEDEEGE